MAKFKGTRIILPIDVRVSTDFTEDRSSRVVTINQVGIDDMILDFGPKTMNLIESEINSANKILWNGPLGVFERDEFSYGTRCLAEFIEGASGYTIAGGGDTLSAINSFININMLDYVSTGGGAFMEI